ncbi:MAG: IS30 family transposase, partial [Paludibacteraceae bacterium]
VGPENKGAILTATERTTGFLLMRKLKKGKNAKNLLKEIVLMMLPYKKFVHSITSDNGTEFYEHKEIARRLNTSYFFAHPYASYQRGLNEYTNGLIRQYITKKQHLDTIDEKFIILIQHKINKRPRKKLNFENPKNLFFQKIALES